MFLKTKINVLKKSLSTCSKTNTIQHLNVPFVTVFQKNHAQFIAAHFIWNETIFGTLKKLEWVSFEFGHNFSRFFEALILIESCPCSISQCVPDSHNSFPSFFKKVWLLF